MMLHPAVIALLLSSLLVGSFVVYSACHGFRIVRSWDLSSGSELQLALERRTYLISTILAYAFVFQLFSLFLLVYTADSICTLFTGAMCAAGTLAVNSYGYPVLLLKVVNFLLAGTWLIMNHADARGYDYPLIKKKYLLLLLIAPLVAAETVLLVLYVGGLRPEVITSCCGSLFSTSGTGVSSEVAALPAGVMRVAFFAASGLALVTGSFFYRTGKGGYLFSLSSYAAFSVSLAALISFISLYIYELPTHHCPFCLLQKEYGYAGYPLYLALFGSAVSGMGVGVLMPFRNVKSLAEYVPGLQKRLTLLSLASLLLFVLYAAYRIASADLRL